MKKAGLTLLKMALTVLLAALLLHLLKVDNLWICAAIAAVVGELVALLLKLLLRKES